MLVRFVQQLIVPVAELSPIMWLHHQLRIQRPAEGLLSRFRFSTIMKKSCYKHLCAGLCENTWFSFLFRKYPGGGLLGQMVSVCLLYTELLSHFPKGPYISHADLQGWAEHPHQHVGLTVAFVLAPASVWVVSTLHSVLTTIP